MIVESYEDVIVLSGSLTQNHWETIHTAISLLLKRHPSGVIIDCSQLTDTTLEGAETFHHAVQYVRGHKDARVVVAAVPPKVLEIIKQVPDVRSQLPISETVEEARRSLDLLVQETTKKGRKEKTYVRKILACICPTSKEDYLITVVHDLVDKDKTKVIFLIPVIVPRELPLQSPLPDVEQAAKEYAALAHEKFEAGNVGHEIRVERARDFASLVIDTADAIDAAHVVVGLPLDLNEDSSSAKMVRSLVDRVTRPIIFCRGRAPGSKN